MYTVRVYDHLSDAVYVYGPFRTTRDAQTFCADVRARAAQPDWGGTVPQWDVERIDVLNNPRTFATGAERTTS